MFNILVENPIFFVFLGGIIFLALWNVLLQIQHWLIRKKLKTFFNGKKASDLEGVLFEEIKRLKKAEEGIKGLSKNLKSVEKMAERSIQKASVVRFNPFKERGEAQIFVIALFNSRDNGLVITSLFTRQGN
ncbi:MAG: DUF4446 family protein, partial [Candidatus Portnoybacteria bacterium]|nr:DUF4446 family protein [Candidatus Portnoybacteria bacterium]